MRYHAMNVADYVISYSNDHNMPISNLKLQKLLYYIQAASLVETGNPAFTDKITAWRYGPVVESVYYAYRIHINKNIDHPTERDDPPQEIRTSDQLVFKKVINSYKKYDSFAMVRKTHSEKPWREVSSRKGNEITVESIKEYYMNHREQIYG